MVMQVHSETERQVNSAELLALVSEIFENCGMSAKDAGLLADSLVYADLGGVHSHGVLRVTDYIKKLTHDGVNPQGLPKIVQDSGACIVVDGGNSMWFVSPRSSCKRFFSLSSTARPS